MKKITTFVTLCAVLSSGAAQAALNDRGGGLIYDDVLNITWLQDANYAQTIGENADGRDSFGWAENWVANLSFYDSVRDVTYDDWRLPKIQPINGTNPNYAFSMNGSTDQGFNISAPESLYAGSTASEMPHLFYNTLGNKGFYSIDGVGPQAGWGELNSGPFINLQANYYWASNGFFFDFGNGDQVQGGGITYAWAVRDGDVAAITSPIPEPETYAMFMAGLGLMGLMARRRKNG